MVLAHVSDLHFGRIADRGIVGALASDIREARAAVVLVGGDLTQRSRYREWRGALDLLGSLPGSKLVIAGNHDVYAWWFPIRRLLNPLGRYRRMVGDAVDVTLQNDRIAVVGLNSAFGWTVKGGRFDAAQARLVEERLSEGNTSRYRVLLVHHQIRPSTFTGRGDVARGSEGVLSAAARAGVDIVFDGHIHRSSIGLLDVGGRTLIHSSAGTATSDRGRFEDQGRNLYTLVRLTDSGDRRVSVEERVFDREITRFRPERTTEFRSDDSGWTIAVGGAGSWTAS